MASGPNPPMEKHSAAEAVQRAELERVLASAAFRRAPTLANFLRYLCEKRFAGEQAQIKEYSIGVDVFARGESFDPDNNSIVRVEANRLRKRLADFYAGEGGDHSLRIVIPLGQYVPEFVSTGVKVLNAEAEQPVAPIMENPIARFLHWSWWVMVAVLLLMGLVLWWTHRPAPQTAAYKEAPSPANTDAERIGPPAGEEIRILAGASRGFVDHAGRLWNADAWYSGGDSVKSQVRHIERTQDQEFYRSSRQGSFHYDIPVQPGVHELRLHFAETVYGPEGTEAGGEGSRLITVRANGRPLLENLDIVADAGASDTADVKVFHDVTAAADGRLHLEFTGANGRPAVLSAIEILPGLRGRIRPIRLLTRQTPYYSNDSQWWSPDNYFSGGQMASYQTPVNASDPELYESERWGNFSYAIPVSPGKYTVALYFAVRREGASRGAHRFNVFCNGRSMLQEFDPSKEAHGAETVVRRFQGIEANAQGKIAMAFVPVEGYATVTGIEVLPQ